MARQVVVIGAGVGGLSAAIHLRLRGFDVLVLERQAIPGGKAAEINVQGYRLDPGPSIVILKRLYDALFLEAGRRVEDYIRFQPLDPFTRVFFEGQPSVDLPADREACLDVLSDRFPVDALSLRRLLERADRIIGDVDRTVFKRPFDYPWQLAKFGMIRISSALGGQKPYKQVVDRWFQSPGLRAFFYGFPSYGGQTYDSVAPGAFLIPYLMLSEGVYYPEGGVAQIPKSLHRLAAELGVEFRFSGPVSGLKIDGNRIQAAITADGPVDADSFVCNLDRFTAGEWLGRHIDLSPSLSYFTVHWGLNRVQKELIYHNLFVPSDFELGFEQLYRQRRFPDSPIVYINATSAVDPGVAPEGCSNIFAVATSQAMTDNLDWRALLPSARESVLGSLAKCGFEFDQGSIEFERIQTPITFAERDGNYRGSLYGADERYRLFGMMPPRNWDEKYRNLYYCGGSVQPGAGLPMVLLSGKFAAERVGKR